MFAGLTIMHYPPKRTDDVYRHIRGVLVPYHREMQAKGMTDAMFMVNPESCQGIGISFFENVEDLKEYEGATTREAARAVRDSTQAPTEYTRRRAKYVEDLGGAIVSSDWYEVIGRVTSGSAQPLFPSVPQEKEAYAGVTVMNYPPKRTQDVYRHIRSVLVPLHEQMQGEGMTDALFMVNPESCQGIGISIFDDPKNLRKYEQGTSREMARAIRDPDAAPTEYTRRRAEYVYDLGGAIVSTDWYAVIGRVFPTVATGTPATMGSGDLWSQGRKTEREKH
jgi:hypothetical protein